jgi:hypothetical protein
MFNIGRSAMKLPPVFRSVSAVGTVALASLFSANAANAETLNFSEASGTWAQQVGGFFPAAHLIDGVFFGLNGWAIFRGGTDPTWSETAFLKLATPLAAGTYELSFVIHQNLGGSLGNFGFAFSTDPSPTLSSSQMPMLLIAATSTTSGVVATLSGSEAFFTGPTTTAAELISVQAMVTSAAPITGVFLNLIDTNGNSTAGGGPGRGAGGDVFLNELTGTFIGSPIPEPATWLTFAAGLFALRRARHLLTPKSH